MASLAAVVIIAAVFIYVFVLKPMMDHRGVHIMDKIHLLKEETVPLRIKIVSHADGEMVLVGKFYDLDGRAVGRFETPFNNNGPISLHFVDVDIDNHHIIFPESMSLSDGASEIDLHQYYSTDGVPHIYDSELMDPLLIDEISRIFSMLREGRDDQVENLYGKVCNLNTFINHPCERVNYEVQTTSSGKVFFID